jgi:hypothetical protein
VSTPAIAEAEQIAPTAEPAVERTTDDSSLFTDFADYDFDDNPAKANKPQVRKAQPARATQRKAK